MAKTRGKRTRNEVYGEILAKSGILLDACEVLTYEFENEGRQQAFHYKIMRHNILLRLYDGTDNVARVLIDKGDKRARGQVDAFAVEAGGREI